MVVHMQVDFAPMLQFFCLLVAVVPIIWGHLHSMAAAAKVDVAAAVQEMAGAPGVDIGHDEDVPHIHLLGVYVSEWMRMNCCHTDTTSAQQDSQIPVLVKTHSVVAAKLARVLGQESTQEEHTQWLVSTLPAALMSVAATTFDKDTVWYWTTYHPAQAKKAVLENKSLHSLMTKAEREAWNKIIEASGEECKHRGKGTQKGSKAAPRKWVYPKEPAARPHMLWFGASGAGVHADRWKSSFKAYAGLLRLSHETKDDVMMSKLTLSKAHKSCHGCQWGYEDTLKFGDKLVAWVFALQHVGKVDVNVGVSLEAYEALVPGFQALVQEEIAAMPCPPTCPPPTCIQLDDPCAATPPPFLQPTSNPTPLEPSRTGTQDAPPSQPWGSPTCAAQGMPATAADDAPEVLAVQGARPVGPGAEGSPASDVRDDEPGAPDCGDGAGAAWTPALRAPEATGNTGSSTDPPGGAGASGATLFQAPHMHDCPWPSSAALPACMHARCGVTLQMQVQLVPRPGHLSHCRLIGFFDWSNCNE